MNVIFNENSVKSKRILYTPSAFAKKNLLYLQETGTLTALKPHTSTRSNLPSYLFFTVISGEGFIKYGNEEIALQKGDCVFLDCMKRYSHKTADNLWQISWVHLSGKSVGKIYEKYIERGGKNVFRAKDSEKYISILDDLYEVSSSDDYIKDMRINELLSSLLTEIMKTSLRGESYEYSDKKEHSVTEIKEYLDRNFTARITLDELSKKFFINKYYLTRVFKSRYGVSILSYINNLKITKAKRRLRFTNDTVETISKECGFEDSNYFSRAFKKLEGISPLEYRKMWVQ